MIFGLKRMSFMICIPRKILFLISNQEECLDEICNKYGGRRGVYRFLVGKLGTKRTFGSPRRRQWDNIEVDVKGVERRHRLH
jgi:hypothetical protein